MDPGYHQLHNQQYYSDQSSHSEPQFVGASHGAIGEVLPHGESHSRTVVDLGAENAGTK